MTAAPAQVVAPDHPARSPGPWRRLRIAAGDIKLAHSVFAMPFAVLGVFLAWNRTDWGGLTGRLALVVLCMVLARTWAMLVNRLADRRMDAANPRTARRAVPSGRLAERDARTITIGAAALFVLACSLFGVLLANWWPLALSIPVLAWIAFYSFTKRFTWLCHLFLGGALAASPLAAAIAVDPGALSRTTALWWLAGMVLLWVAGFDVIYALQDVDFDRAHGVFSIPARLGPGRAILVSRTLHLGSLSMLAMTWKSDARLGGVFAAGVLLVAGLLITEHIVLARRGKAGLEMAFFTLNGIVSCVLGVAGVLDLVVL